MNDVMRRKLNNILSLKVNEGQKYLLMKLKGDKLLLTDQM